MGRLCEWIDEDEEEIEKRTKYMSFESALEKWIIDMKKLIPENYRFCGKLKK